MNVLAKIQQLKRDTLFLDGKGTSELNAEKRIKGEFGIYVKGCYKT